MKKIISRVLICTSILAAGVIASDTANASEQPWVARTVDQVKADITSNEYTIVWGDTLSAISGATNITVEKLAEWNSISNIDLIYAGNKLVFDGNVVTLKDSSGNVVIQSVIRDDDKVDSNKAIGGANNSTNNTGNVTTPPTSGDNSSNDSGSTTPPAEGDNGSETENGITVTVVGENETFTRFRVGPFLNTDDASKWVKENYPNGIKGYEVHPDGDYIYIEFEVAKPTPDEDNGTGGGEVTPPEEDNGTGGGDNGSGGGETTNEPNWNSDGTLINKEIVTNIGNSGEVFKTFDLAKAYAEEQTLLTGPYPSSQYSIYSALNVNGLQIGHTVHFADK